MLPDELKAVAMVMRRFPAPWCFAGGWAVDLYLGRVTRSHGDIDLALFRADQMLLRHHLVGWRFQKVVDGKLTNWHESEWLRLPVHEMHADRTEGSPLTLEFLLNEQEGNYWTYRRDPAVRRAANHIVVRSKMGVPVLCPAVVLLYKAKDPRPEDDHDFRQVQRDLGVERREWLRGALERCHPGHPWLATL